MTSTCGCSHRTSAGGHGRLLTTFLAALLTACVCCSGKFAREAVEVGRYECLDHERNYTNV